jgi:hypothetical protein
MIMHGFTNFKFTCYSYPNLMKFEFLLKIFGNYSCVKLHENSLSGRRVVPSGQMDRQKYRHNDAFCNFAIASKQKVNSTQIEL